MFGATGDLARKKLLPAIYRLSREGALREGFQVLALARDRNLDDAGFRKLTREALRDAGIEDLDAWCDRCMHYQRMQGDEDDYEALARRVEGIEREAGLPGNRIFYLAVPPKIFATVVEGLGSVGLNRAEGFVRLVVEKPFGQDLESARDLNELVHRWFDESQVYRIDHFLGKETVQNLLVFRFANAFIESQWNRNHVDSVQISVAEDSGIDGRAGYYDEVGALRDMIQNHLTQLLTLVAMGVPTAYDAESIRFEKVKVLRAIAPPRPEDVVLGRYVRARVDGSAVPGYLQEEGVPEDSRTETFAALRLRIDNWRWQGVPFYLRTGKRMKRRSSEVAIEFRQPPIGLFERSGWGSDVRKDVLVLTLQPDEGFSMHVDVKRPTARGGLEKVPLEFKYRSAFGDLPDAYVTLLLDVAMGDRTLFVDGDEAELAWSLYQPLLEHRSELHEYPAGAWGPDEARELLARDGREWREGS